jgi:hypothetical protein
MMILILKIIIDKSGSDFNRSYQLSFKNTDFETFDRIEFYKKYIQPLYEELGNGTEDLMILKNFPVGMWETKTFSAAISWILIFILY